MRVASSFQGFSGASDRIYVPHHLLQNEPRRIYDQWKEAIGDPTEREICEIYGSIQKCTDSGAAFDGAVYVLRLG